MRSVLSILTLVFLFFGSCCNAAISNNIKKTVTLTVYTAFEADLLSRYKAAFEIAHPNIKINWVRDSTGVITAKLIAEKNNPRADLIWGLAGSSMALLKKEGILSNYQPVELSHIRTTMMDQDKTKAWFGNQAFFNAICYNKVIGKQKHLPKPKSWQDLLKPIYRGQISMPNPDSSGTGYMLVASWLQSMGHKSAWHYMEQLNKNIAFYTHSGSKPCTQTAMGEVAIGISEAIRGAQLKDQGAPIDVYLPKEGIGWDVESVALVKNSHHTAAAKVLLNWSLTRKANEQYAQKYAIVGYKGITKHVNNYPDVVSKMITLDFDQMAKERAGILKIWSNKFDHKTNI